MMVLTGNVEHKRIYEKILCKFVSLLMHLYMDVSILCQFVVAPKNLNLSCKLRKYIISNLSVIPSARQSFSYDILIRYEHFTSIAMKRRKKSGYESNYSEKYPYVANVLNREVKQWWDKGGILMYRLSEVLWCLPQCQGN